ncbi:MAG: TetR/AcrR family transcriptional regulator [Pseudomonadota bacterium]
MTTKTKTKPVQKRRTQERTEITQRRLKDAAIAEFSDKGFDGVTARDIEVRANVQRGLLKYHFGDKANLWKEAISQIFSELSEYRAARLEMAQDLPLDERLAFRIRSFVRFTAKRPELNRLMLQEGKSDSWRMGYLIDNFLQDNVRELRELVAAEYTLSDRDFFHWYYAFLGAGTLAFNVAPEASRLFGVDVNDESVITGHAKITADFLIGYAKQRSAENTKKK